MSLVSVFLNIGTSFSLGLLTPLGALCVLPMYPGFLVYLSSQMKKEPTKKRLTGLGLIVVSGVVSFMLLIGILFTTILKVSLTKVIGIVSPIAFVILALIGILLMFNINFGKIFPKVKSPITKKPLLNTFLFGFFFGAIVIPCNPGFIAAFFARTILFDSLVFSLSNFLAFGLGIGFPLIVLSFLSGVKSNAFIKFLNKYQKTINFIAGAIMLLIALYYLFFVFKIFG